MSKFNVPKTMRVWQYTTTSGGLENTIKLNSSAPVPTPKDSQHLVKVIAAALNPIDYKPAEMPIGRLIPKPATPGDDFVGRIVIPAKDSSLKPGDIVFGASGSNPMAGGALAEYAVTGTNASALVPEGLDPVDAATICVAGLTAYQSTVSHTKAGDRVFINGGSGGTGSFGIQLAKAHGCHVTTTCSTANVELVKSLGADTVIDYKKSSVLDALTAQAKESGPFAHAVDNIGMNKSLYWKAQNYLAPSGTYVMVGGELGILKMIDSLRRKLTPSFLGGMQRHMEGFWPHPNPEELSKIAAWMKEGKVKSTIDHKYAFEEVPEAIRRSKTGRSRGKIVVLVEE